MAQRFALLGIGSALLLSSAHALAQSCDEIKAMVNVDVPVNIIVQTMENSGKSFTVDDIRCLSEGGVDERIVDAARDLAQQDDQEKTPEAKFFVGGLGEAETTWLRDYQAQAAAGFALMAEHLGLDVSRLRLVVAYESERVQIYLVQEDFDPTTTPTVVADYPSPYLIYHMQHVERVQTLLASWYIGALTHPGMPLALRPAFGKASLAAGFERKDRPGTTMLVGAYLSQGRPSPSAPIVLLGPKKSVSVFPVDSSGWMWAIPPMVGPDGAPTEAAVLWKFMGWDVLAPKKSGRPTTPTSPGP